MDKILEPHIKDYLSTMLKHAQAQEEKAEALFAVNGIKPSNARKLEGNMIEKSRQPWADVIALDGGATGS